MALERALEILNLKVDITAKDGLKLLAIQKETLTAVLTTQARVSTDAMRVGKSDRISDLIARIKASKET